MRRLAILLVLILALLTIGAKTQKNAQKWQYASLTLIPSTETVIWRAPDGVIEGNSFFELASKLKCDKPMSFPPEQSIISHYGNNGWELIQCIGKEDSMCGAYICWFKRPVN